jgi:hypothetical protein
MVLLIKLSSFAFNVFDANQPDEVTRPEIDVNERKWQPLTFA